jgi:tetratricopeptide (TPR) repeat protein
MSASNDDTVLGDELTVSTTRPLQRLQTVGRYVVLERIGEGGMGIVYAAYDPELDRKVALKLLHASAPVRMREDHVRGNVMHKLFGDAPPQATPAPAVDQTRLLREAQAAARISDPHVVTVHDVGQHEGRVFIAMEYVQGITLAEWIAATTRGWREVLRVILDAGEGLAAAHDKGVVHRDFKPDNVMIGDDGRVRVMDFGLAHGQPAEPITEEIQPTNDALGRHLTRDGAVMGTPAYMAPEQFLARETDTRTDQFAFCVAAWEALYGARPFVGDSVASLAVAVTQGRREPIPASAAVPAHVRRALERGLATDPDARHPSMHAVLSELRRDPTRPRRWIAAGTTLAALGIAGWATWELDRRAVLERCDEEAAAVDGVWNEDARASIEAVMRDSGLPFAEATIERLHPWFDAYAQEWSSARAEACRTVAFSPAHEAELAAQSIDCLDERLGELQSIVTAMQQPGPHVIRRAVSVAAALPPLQACRDAAALARRPVLPTDAEERERVLALRRRLAESAALEASGQFEAALDRIRDVPDEASAHPRLRARARYRIGALHDRLGNYDAAAEELAAAALDSAALGEDDNAAEAAARLAVVVAERKADYPRGLVWGQWAEAFVRRSGADDTLLAASIHNHLGVIERGQGRPAEALAHYEQSLAIKERILGVDHPDVALALNNLGTARTDLGEFDAAATHYRHALALYEIALGPQHPDTAMPLVNLAEIEWRRGRLGDAREDLERAIAIQEGAFGTTHPTVALSVGNLGLLLAELGDHEGAIALHERSLAIIEPALGPEHPRIAAALGNLGDAQRNLGRYDAARQSHERSLAMREKLLGPDHPEVALALLALGKDRRVAGELEEAVQLVRRAMTIIEKALGSDHPDLGAVLTELGRTELELGRDTATATLERAIDLLDRHEAPERHRGHARLHFARALWPTDHARAIEAAKRARELLLAAGPTGADDLAQVDRFLAEHP